MLNVGPGELIVIFVAALLLLGPKRLPEVARGLGKFLREFRRQTDEVRTVVEREFYRMDQELEAPLESPAAPAIAAPQPAEPNASPIDPSLASTQKEFSVPTGTPVPRPVAGAAQTPAVPAPRIAPLDPSTAATQQLPAAFVPGTPVAREARPAPAPAEPTAPTPPPSSRQE